MKIALIGYGKMGRIIDERIQREGKHEVVARVSSSNQNELPNELKKAEVAIEFTQPGSVLKNIFTCTQLNVPVVVGTTGWYNQLDEVKMNCQKQNRAVVYSSNYSIGVNLFFALNEKLAQLMSKQKQFDTRITEIHHTQKKDSPSGTAITLANDVLKYSPVKKRWVNEMSGDKSELIILSRREGNVAGTHIVDYQSLNDRIEIKHESFNREAFAEGAIMAAEWIVNKKGFFEFKDILQLS